MIIVQFLALIWYTLSYIPYARDLVWGCLTKCGPNKNSLRVRPSGQVQWQCQNPICRTDCTIPRGSDVWCAAIALYNIANPKTTIKTKK